MTAVDAMAERLPFFRIGRWLVELVLVFLGVYAAFWLSNYQQERQNTRRRDQILASLEQQLREGIEITKKQGADAERQVAGFEQALAAGQMPPLRPFTFTSDYNAGDIAALLQSGGIELLAVKTLMALREFESVVRWGLSRMAHFQKLSDELIVPNLDQDISFFYDPTKHLRKRFELYTEALHAEANFFRDLQRGQSNLLTQIQAERARH